MSGETPITMTGNVVADPELRFTPAGAAVCNFRMAATPRKFNRQTNAWEDGEPLFLGVAVWRQQAEHVASSVLRGMRVIVVGHLTQRQYEDREGKTRSSYEIQADEVAPSLLRATAVVTKANGTQQGAPQAYGQQPAGDQWATGGYGNEPAY
ncbi:single-stranded DNA-binding protein [Streptomyces sp. TRM66268-LWL]|uniref:Single-stranded DNA-binding protein n=1 Tax=Streptomyces polyasparticus TaxID=2767826 RepID=A0ABR7SIC3_9ACTN|nr:single-stranded DNA-binding protein [Streptomyces polyasparticus]MBC9714058.1 single-stranded DNA-binding protein [Streptomyces polyasparticus]